MRDDRALQRRALRKVVDPRRDAVEDEPQDVRVAVVALADEPESAPKAHDVRIGREILGELRIEEPRRADRETRRSLGKVTREERARLRQRVVARLWGERPALGDVDAERGFTLAECVRDVRRAHVHTGELKTAELIDRAAEMEREPPAGPKAPVAEQQSIAFEVAAEVGERGPRHLIGNSPPRMEAAHVGERRQVDVGEEIAAERWGN